MQLTEQDLFSAIKGGLVDTVKDCLKSGVSLNARSARGLTPLAEVGMSLYEEKTKALNSLNEMDEDHVNNLVQNQSNSSVLMDGTVKINDEILNAARDIGVILIKGGANLEERMGRTNRTISVHRFMKAHFEDVHKDWIIAQDYQNMADIVAEQSVGMVRPETPIRKI